MRVFGSSHLGNNKGSIAQMPPLRKQATARCFWRRANAPRLLPPKQATRARIADACISATACNDRPAGEIHMHSYSLLPDVFLHAVPYQFSPVQGCPKCLARRYRTDTVLPKAIQGLLPDAPVPIYFHPRLSKVSIDFDCRSPNTDHPV